MNLLKKLWNKLFAPECYKTSMGYNCKHGNHNGLRECDGKPI